MALKSLFASMAKRKALPQADAVNEAGGRAYALTSRQALAQYAATGTLASGFYADAEAQMKATLALAHAADAEFLAKTAVYAFERGNMKDMPALLLAVLSQKGDPQSGELFGKAFGRVVRNGRMLRNFVQIMRSGQTGRSSLGSRPKRLVRDWIDAASPVEILRAAVGADPSLADVVKMVHPRPQTPERAALYGWLIGRPYDFGALPQVVQDFEAFKRDMSGPVPEVPFQMLTSLPLGKAHWREIARKAGWQMLRQNLNAFARIGMFHEQGFTRMIAGRLSDREEIRRARLMPYQLMTTLDNLSAQVPPEIRKALDAALDVSLKNVLRFDGRIVVAPDVSGSMGSPVTGHRKGATTATRCVDVAGLMTAAFLRANPGTLVLPFDHRVHAVDFGAEARIFETAKRLASYGGGGTNMAAPMEELLKRKAQFDLLIFVSDNESWINGRSGPFPTAAMEIWSKLKKINPEAKMVCLDLQPSATTQMKNAPDVLNLGGFSDQVFDVIASFARSEDADHWVARIEEVVL
ncbi:RNA-binding protein [Neomegalonema sp.]|uniref:vWA domain-containing protein n=1 Tax=Neomegalonema sp. TaxID=2039713 RepID=UPI0026384EE7|nr:RNA-binding protein [Neomegalonema sp.]MDD2867886.1 RNA-binding protein [Neomegalonema sp.]